jgi:hypothetical protein
MVCVLFSLDLAVAAGLLECVVDGGGETDEQGCGGEREGGEGVEWGAFKHGLASPWLTYREVDEVAVVVSA